MFIPGFWVFVAACLTDLLEHPLPFECFPLLSSAFPSFLFLHHLHAPCTTHGSAQRAGKLPGVAGSCRLNHCRCMAYLLLTQDCRLTPSTVCCTVLTAPGRVMQCDCACMSRGVGVQALHGVRTPRLTTGSTSPAVAMGVLVTGCMALLADTSICVSALWLCPGTLRGCGECFVCAVLQRQLGRVVVLSVCTELVAVAHWVCACAEPQHAVWPHSCRLFVLGM